MGVRSNCHPYNALRTPLARDPLSLGPCACGYLSFHLIIMLRMNSINTERSSQVSCFGALIACGRVGLKYGVILIELLIELLRVGVHVHITRCKGPSALVRNGEHSTGLLDNGACTAERERQRTCTGRVGSA